MTIHWQVGGLVVALGLGGGGPTGAGATAAPHATHDATGTAAPRGRAVQPTDTIEERITLAAAVASALATHPAVEGARARLDAAEAGTGQARAARLPTLAATGTATRYAEPMVVAPLHGFDPRNPPSFDETLYQAHGMAEYTLFDGGARSARIRASERETEAARAAVAGTRDGVLVDVVSAYLTTLSAREVRVAYARQVEALESELDRARLLLAEGTAPRLAVLRAEATLSEANAALEAADQRLRLALRRLARISGLDEGRLEPDALAELRPPGEPVPDREKLVSRALESNPRVLEARSRAAAAEAAVGAARSALLPTLELAGRYSALGSATTSPALEWQAGIQVRYPIFTGGARGRGVERAAALASAAAAAARGVERAVADAVDASLLAYRSEAARAAALESAVAQTREVVRIEALALEAGAGVQTDYLRAEAALLRARAGLAEARHAAMEARIRLAQATGRLDAQWLERWTEGVER